MHSSHHGSIHEPGHPLHHLSIHHPGHPMHHARHAYPDHVSEPGGEHDHHGSIHQPNHPLHHLSIHHPSHPMHHERGMHPHHVSEASFQGMPGEHTKGSGHPGGSYHSGGTELHTEMSAAGHGYSGKKEPMAGEYRGESGVHPGSGHGRTPAEESDPAHLGEAKQLTPHIQSLEPHKERDEVHRTIPPARKYGRGGHNALAKRMGL